MAAVDIESVIKRGVEQALNEPIMNGKSVMQWAEIGIHSQEQPQWISVKKKLPKLAGRYLAYRPRFWAWGRGQATVCFWDGKNWFDDYVDAEEYKLSEDSVSHWMPLPEPPKEVTQDG